MFIYYSTAFDDQKNWKATVVFSDSQAALKAPEMPVLIKPSYGR